MKEITERAFAEEVLDCELPVYACFTASWCTTCYPVCQSASELVEEYRGRIKFVRLDMETSPGLVEKYSITAVPTVIVFYRGRPVHRIISYVEKPDIRDMLDAVASGGYDPVRE